MSDNDGLRGLQKGAHAYLPATGEAPIKRGMTGHRGATQAEHA
jgi:hypothetical protein